MTADVVRMHTIQRVLNEFIGWRASSLDPEARSAYRACIASFETSIDDHAPRLLSASERELYRRGNGDGRQFSEMFGPDKIPGEMRYFLTRFLADAVSEDPDVLEQAPIILADLCSWLEWKGYIPESELEAAVDELARDAQHDSVNV